MAGAILAAEAGRELRSQFSEFASGVTRDVESRT